jgi:hypothetical protein
VFGFAISFTPLTKKATIQLLHTDQSQRSTRTENIIIKDDSGGTHHYHHHNAASIPEELFPDILAHLDVVTLIKKKQVCRNWQQMCTDVMMSRGHLPHEKHLKPSTNWSWPCESTLIPKLLLGMPKRLHLRMVGPLTSGMFPVCKTIRISSAGPIDSTRTFPCGMCHMPGPWHACSIVLMPLIKTCRLGIRDKSEIFPSCSVIALYSTNSDISSWNVSNATNKNAMFLNARSFPQSLASWNTSMVIDMCYMFCCLQRRFVLVGHIQCY